MTLWPVPFLLVLQFLWEVQALSSPQLQQKSREEPQDFAKRGYYVTIIIVLTLYFLCKI